MKNKLLLLFLALLLSNMSSFAITVDELTEPKEPAYRVGVGAEPERIYKVSESDKKLQSKEANIDKTSEAVKNITYADLSLKKIAKEISDDGELTQNDVIEDIKLLWIGAAQNSETVKFIVYKLSNPDEDKPNENIVKKIIQPISTVGSLAGIGMGNPIGALSAIMGSSILGSMSVDDKDLNYKFSKVNDADMVVLIRKIEELQRKIVNYYFDYMSARESLIKSDEIVAKRRNAFMNSADLTDDQVIMVDAYYRSALNMQSKLRSDFLARRAALEQTVGSETLAQFENIIEEREKQDKK